MKTRICCLLLALASVFCLLPLTGCREEAPRTVICSADTSSAAEPDGASAEEADFFTANGQAFLPEPSELPSYCTGTDTAHLYRLPADMPALSEPTVGWDEEEAVHPVESLRLVGDTLHLVYRQRTGVFYRVLSPETGALLTEKALPQGTLTSCPDGSYSGALADGGFWIAECAGMKVTFYDREGTETVVRRSDSAYRDALAPYLLAVSPDGKTLLAAFETGTPFLLLDLDSGKKTRLTADTLSQRWSLPETRSDGFLLAGSAGDLLYIGTEAPEVTLLPGGDPICGASGSLYRLDVSGQGLLLRGESGGGTQLFLADFLQETERAAAFGFGCCATVDGENTVRFYDLREGICFAEVPCEGAPAVFLTESGQALLAVCGQVSSSCFLYDLPAARADGIAEPTAARLLPAATLQEANRLLAAEIGETYGIEIFCGSEGNDFDIGDYLGVAALEPQQIYSSLRTVESLLSRYPEGMLRETYTGIFDSLQLYLCGSLYGVGSGGVGQAAGVTTVTENHIVIAVDIYDNLRYVLPHELSHAFDTRIQVASYASGTDWLAVWEEATPLRDAYLNRYDAYWEALPYTPDDPAGSEIWFTDPYARTYPTEDRACIMELLFNPNGEELADGLQAPNLQYKARLYCYLLRQCFSSCSGDGPFYWETALGPIDGAEFASLLQAAA